jgi:transposase-like protein
MVSTFAEIGLWSKRAPSVGDEEFVKNGRLHGKQRYKCKACDYTFTVSKLGQVKPLEVLRMALQLAWRV